MKKAKLPLKEHKLFINGKLFRVSYSYGKVQFKNIRVAEKYMKKSLKVDCWDMQTVNRNENNVYVPMKAYSSVRDFKPNTRYWRKP